MARRKKAQVGDWVIVEWIDAVSTAVWVDIESLEEVAHCPDFISNGRLMVMNDRQIILASTFGTNERGEISEVGEVTGIPIGMITKMIKDKDRN